MPGTIGGTAGILCSGTEPLWAEATLYEVPEGGFDLAGEIPEYSLADAGLSIKSYLDRVSSHTLMAVSLALGETREETTGISFATRWGPLSSMKLFFEKVRQNPRFAPPLPFSHSYANSPASAAAIEFGLKGWHCVFSDGDASGLDALAAASWEADQSGSTIVVAAADALSVELYSYYKSQGTPGLPSPESPSKFVPSEAAVGLVVKPSGPGRKVTVWGNGLRDGVPADAPERVYTDAYTFNRARYYDEALGENRSIRHVGLRVGNAGPALGLLAVAAAAADTGPSLILAGGRENTTMILLE
ncbi:MAG: hypothetical protein JW909_02880 [Planctomycetes bacterium]|nr:hypothetical protein [Planctomycetota bacterium]